MTYSTFGQALVDDLFVPARVLDRLFAALLLTMFGVFLGANILLLNGEVFLYATPVAACCLGLVLLFYALSRLTGSVAWGLVLVYAALVAVVYLRLPALFYLMHAFFFAAAIYALRSLRVERQYWWSVTGMAVTGSLLVLGAANDYTSFDMLPRLHAGQVHQDTLFHASIAAMIKHYGEMSTGLNGLVEVPYHVLSHVLMAGISTLSGAHVVEVYGVAHSLFFAPLLLFTLSTACAMIDREGKLAVPLVWNFNVLLLLALPLLFKPWGLWDSFFVSESYLVSLGLLALGLGLLYRRHLRVADLALVALLSLLMSNAKASVGLIYAGLWFVRLIWLPGRLRIHELAAFFLSMAAVAWSVIDMAGAASGGIAFSPVHFVRTYSEWGGYLDSAGKALLNGVMPSFSTLALALAALISYVVFHFVVSWGVVLPVALQHGPRGLTRVPVAVYSLAAATAGLLVGLLFAIPGGSAYYFSNVAFMVSLPAVCATLVAAWQRQRRNERLLAVICGAAIVIASWDEYYEHSVFFAGRSARVENPTIGHLLQINERSPLHLVLRPASDLVVDNPVERCTARPFVFPAVSERAWVGVIPVGEGCRYADYGYAQYGLNAPGSAVTLPPRLLPGMRLETD